jgi:tRNA A58 N-methylase Trm61
MSTGTPTIEQVEAAKTWLREQRAVVHPGPIETIEHALSVAEAQARQLTVGVAYEGFLRSKRNLQRATGIDVT